MSLAPIAVFTYKRVDTLKQVIKSLLNAELADQSDVFIFSDGAKGPGDVTAVDAVREYIKQVTGFKNIEFFFSEKNQGLAKSITSGVSSILNRYESVIVLEDDLVVSQNFLTYMNQALNHYSDNPKVFSISGFSMPINGLGSQDIYFTQRASSWGWATWSNRWQNLDWGVKGYDGFYKNRKARAEFNNMGSDMSYMLDRQMQNKINSWAIIWCFNQYLSKSFTVFPAKSKVINIGFSSPDATHTKEKYNRFKTYLDKSNKSDFSFDDDVKLKGNIVSQFIRPYSIPQRIYYKILNKFF